MESTTQLFFNLSENGTIFSNHTLGTPDPEWKVQLKLAYRIILGLVLFFIMLAMGCTITVKQIWEHLRRPSGIVIGATSQFILLPLLAFGLAHALQLTPYHALGLLVVSCSPGGTTSNLFTFWTDGDISLSVCMTCLSTLLALGMMPLNLWIYSRAWTLMGTVIPYINIFITLASTVFPVAIGMVVYKKWPKVAKVLVKVGSACGVLSIVCVITMQAILYPWLAQLPWNMWMCAFILGFLGVGLGYAFATLCRMPYPSRRTVGFETGLQNITVALTVIAMSFSGEKQAKITAFPIVYGITMLLDCFIILGVYRLYLHLKAKSKMAASEGPEVETCMEDTQSQGKLLPNGTVDIITNNPDQGKNIPQNAKNVNQKCEQNGV